MKYILFFAALSMSVDAVEYELTLKHMSIKQELFSTIEFNQKAVLVGVDVWHDSGFGVGFAYGKGSKESNILEHTNLHENKLNDIITVDLKYRYDITDELAVYVQVGKTDYNTTWYVDGLKPQGWANNRDSGDSYGIGLTYRFNSNLSVSGGFAHLYDKHKKGYGDEEATALVFGVSYRF